MAQANSHMRLHFLRSTRFLLGLLSVGLVGAAAATYPQWRPFAQQLRKAIATNSGVKNGDSPKAAEPEGAHGHGHDHAGHDESNSIKLSEQARKNIGLRTGSVELTTFVKTVSVPGMVVERPGQSVVQITTPMTGIITRIHTIEGEAVEPGRKLFDLRLTHEELVQSQTDLLRTAEELDVTAREIKRIEKLSTDGALAGKLLLERQYESQKLEAVLRSRKQALLLHGLTQTQIDDILTNRELLKDIEIFAPEGKSPDGDSLFQVQRLHASQGQHVEAGIALATLADHAELYIEGEAFERDAAAIGRVTETGSAVSARLEGNEGRPETIEKLRILYVSDKVNVESRTLDFFVLLPNEKQRDDKQADGRRFIGWRYRPGQRVQLQIPVQTMDSRIVLPIEAVAQDGVETYVFVPNGDNLDRRCVHVEYRDTQWAVIANDGSLFPGDMVAISAAQQLQLALKNKAGGGIDPHAGHNH